MVSDALIDQRWIQDVIGGLPVLATWQFLLLWDLLADIQLSTERDEHVWTPCTSRNFSSKSAYDRFFVGGITFEPYKRLWKSWALLKVKFFLWLAAWRRCWTADRLQRRGLPHPDRCPLCDQTEELLITSSSPACSQGRFGSESPGCNFRQWRQDSRLPRSRSGGNGQAEEWAGIIAKGSTQWLC